MKQTHQNARTHLSLPALGAGEEVRCFRVEKLVREFKTEEEDDAALAYSAHTPNHTTPQHKHSCRDNTDVESKHTGFGAAAELCKAGAAEDEDPKTVCYTAAT
jgi:hypothetical protein